ncbi:general substrate transporter [Saccharata proteae CBS 121410]|uniref:General substrate transporter n=1 Tax=Saccharata proteae CBS 121410 TaxID=1314787 RepID=A0A9P4LW91_9PEZI|nr:general substrate transporter [Saccharata proteae CBS 121410]
MSPRISDNAINVKQPQFMGMRGKKLSTVISIVATTGFLLFGYDQGVMSGIINADPFNDYFPQTKNDTTYQGFVTAIYEVGCLLGAILMLLCGDRVGRRRGIIAGAAIMIIGVLVQITAFDGHHAMAQFIVGRTITGFGNGMNTSTIPTYQAECSKAANRGLLICIEGGVIAFGTMIAYWIDYGCSYGSQDLSWRFPIAFQIFFGLIVVVFMIGMPESPRWLLTKDRHDEAMRVIAALRGHTQDSEETKLEAAIVMDSIRASGHAGGNTPFSALFTGGKTQHFRRMMIGASAQLFQQIGGCNAVIYYFPILFENSIGETKNMSLLLGGVNMIVYAIFATTSWFIIERTGRRKLFLIGTVGQCLSMVLVFACLIPGTASAAKGSAVGLFTYIAFFGATWLPLPWLYPAEINPLKTRAKANAVSTITNWLFNFLIVMVTPVMISNIGWGTYLFFAAINGSFFPFIYFFYPETRMRSLEEIDLIFAKSHVEKMTVVRAAVEMPFLSDEDIDAKAREYGFVSEDEEAGQLKEARHGEREKDLAENGGGMMV